MNPLMKLWFWLLIISVIGFIVAFVAFERYSVTNNTSTKTPGWVWVVLIISFLFWIVSLILYALDMANYHRKREIAEACGLIPPPEKKKITCPPKECVEKKVIECVTKRPCEQVAPAPRPCDQMAEVRRSTVVSVNSDDIRVAGPLPSSPPIAQTLNTPISMTNTPISMNTSYSPTKRTQTLRPVSSLSAAQYNVVN